MSIAYRETLAEDEPFIRELFMGLRAVEFESAGLPSHVLGVLLEQQFRAQRGHYASTYPERSDQVLMEGDERVGNLITAALERELRLIDITLAPSHRGRGIGTAVLTSLQARAKAEGKDIVLHVEMHNPAHNLYARLGFTDEELVGIYWRMRWAAITP